MAAASICRPWNIASSPSSVRYPNTFFTANELYQKIWGKESLGDVRTVQVHIHNLRSKIEPDPAKLST